MCDMPVARFNKLASKGFYPIIIGLGFALYMSGYTANFAAYCLISIGFYRTLVKDKLLKRLYKGRQNMVGIK